MLVNPQTQMFADMAMAEAGVIPSRDGNVFFVDSNNGRDRNSGATPFEAFATLMGAIGKCRSNKGDVIILQERHAESGGSAGIFAANVASVKIIGLGRGNQKPVFTLNTAIGASFDVSAAGVLVKNIKIVPAFDAITAMVNVTAADAAFDKVTIEHANATYQSVLGVLTDANADRFRVENSRLYGTPDAGTATAIRIVGGEGHVIENNDIWGNYTTTLGGIENVTTACARARIHRNRIGNLTASSAKAMVFVSTSTGSISGNHMQILTGTAPITGAAMSWVGANYYAAVIATAGTLI